MSKYLALLNKLFQMTCIWLVLFMVYQQFKLYLNNQDSSSVSYRSFNLQEKDLYPTFSICLHSNKGGILKPNFAKNRQYAYATIDQHHKILLGHDNITKELQNIEFDEIALDLLEDFVDMTFTNLLRTVASEWQRNVNISQQSPFYKSYQDPYFRCISKPVSFTKNKILDDIVVFNAHNLYQHISNMRNYLSIETDVLIFVHHRHQLVRELGKKILILTEDDFRQSINGLNDFRDIQMSQVEVLRKRKDGRSKERCDPKLEDDDKMWREKVMEAVNCIPNYWKGLYSYPNMKPPDLPECNSSIQYDYISHNFLPPTIHLENGTNLYREPCDHMNVILSISSTSRKLTETKTLMLRFRYDVEEYREIINREAFGKPLFCKIYEKIKNAQVKLVS